MRPTKLRAPEGFSALSIEGRAVEVERDGSYHADPRDVATLRSHGFADWHDHPGADGDVETMTKPQLVDAVLALTRVEAEKRGEEDLRSALRKSRDGEDAPLRAPGPQFLHLTEADVITMSRKDLFAYLAERQVSIGPATKEDGLRAAVLNEVRKQRAAAA